METLILKNYQLKTAIEALSYNMPFSKGRIKNRFMTILVDKFNAIDKARMEIITALGDKDKDGNLVQIDSKYQFTKNKTKWEEEYNKLMTEECIIDITPSIKPDIGIIKSMYLDSTVMLDNQETAIMEEIMSAFEITKPKKKK